MRFAEIYQAGGPAISFELFPPRTERGMALLKERLPRLAALDPSFMTVTYGAGHVPSSGVRVRHRVAVV